MLVLILGGRSGSGTAASQGSEAGGTASEAAEDADKVGFEKDKAKSGNEVQTRLRGRFMGALRVQCGSI